MVTLHQITGDHPSDSAFIHDLATLFRAAREEHLPFMLRLHDQDEDRHFLSGTVLPANQVWIARVDSHLAGFIAFAGNWVHHLYHAPEFQRRGIGRQLLGMAKASTPHLQLWVFAINTPALQFYERESFRITRRTDGATNEAQQPDILMEWKKSAIS